MSRVSARGAWAEGRRGGRIALRCAFWLAVTMLFAPSAEARVLNLHGVADLTYRWSRIDQRFGGTDLTPSTTTGLQQHYQIGSSGEMLHSNVGSYTFNASLIEDVSRTNGDKSQDLTVKDYYFSVNLLPRLTPVTFYTQRINQDTEAFGGTLGSNATTTTYSLTWDIPLQRLPRLRVNLFQSELKLDAGLASSLQRTRSAALDADGQTGNTHYFARYQLTHLEGEFSGSTSHTVSASVDTKFTPALSGAARVNYSSSVPTIAVVTPGTGTLLQRSAGASLYYRPSLQTTLSGSYDFYKDPFERHLFAVNANLRPLQELDFSSGYRFFRFDVTEAVTTSHYAFAAANYRPILGVSTNLIASLGTTDVTGTTPVSSYYQSYGYGINYLKTLTLVTYRLGYQGGYSVNRLSTGTGTSRDLTNVFSAGVSNNQTRLVALSADYTLALVTHRTSGAEPTDQRDHRLQLTANSSAPRNLFLPGDYLILSAVTSYSISEYGDFTNHVFLFSTTETYETGRGLAATVGYAYERQSQLTYDSKSSTFVQVRWVRQILRSGTLDLNVKQSWESYSGYQADVERSEAGALFAYQIGRISLSADYRLTYETRELSRFLSQAAFFRVARPF